MPWTAEQARENARKGGKARAEQLRKKRDLTDEERARLRLASESPELAEELLRAARGEGVFANLEAKERLGAIQKALEWGIGRPATRKPEAQKPEEPQGGLHVE